MLYKSSVCPHTRGHHAFEHKYGCEHVFTGAMGANQCALQPYARREKALEKRQLVSDSPLTQEAVVMAKGRPLG